jgi:hypothetical protein
LRDRRRRARRSGAHAVGGRRHTGPGHGRNVDRPGQLRDRPGRRTGTGSGETGALLCQTTLGEVEVTSDQLPWRLNVNTEKRTAALHGGPRLALEAHLVELPSVHCLYQAGKATATVSSTEPLSIVLSVPRVKLNKHLSNALCPAVGPLSVSMTLP